MKITSKIKVLVASLAILLVGASVLPASAINCPNGKWVDGTLEDCEVISDNPNNKNNLMETLNVIINVVIGVVGFIAVAVIIIGGIQYTTSAGDAAKVTKAKNTILYGVIGLVVAMLAFAIVNFILSNVFNAETA